jgi:hypothetical protein
MNLLAMLNWVYGPAAQSDPYYLLLRDFIVLMPWWYPFMWVGGIATFFGYKILRRFLWRQSHKRGATRVRNRTQRLIGNQEAELAITRLLRKPANDNNSEAKPIAVA